AQPRKRLDRPGPEGAVVAAEQPLVDCLGLGEDGLERRQVAVHVVEHSQHQSEPFSIRRAANSAKSPPIARYAAAAASKSYSVRLKVKSPSQVAQAARRSPSSGIPALPGLTRSLLFGPGRRNWRWLWPKTIVRSRTPASRRSSPSCGSAAKLSSSASGEPCT